MAERQDPPAPFRESVPYEELPLVERAGIQYVKRLSRSLPVPAAEDAIHVLNQHERAELGRIQRRAVLRSASAGALSALVAVAGVAWADARFAPDADTPTLLQQAVYWGVVFGVGGVAAVFELLFLYRDSLRHTLLMARAAGLPLFDEVDERVDREHAGALVRAALELQNPARPVLGVDPLREAARWKLVLYSLLYKGKVAVTSFLLKLLIRRALGRAMVRGAVVELVAVPVTALWNAVVTWQVMREARLRIVGPSAAETLVGALWADEPSSPQRGGAVRAVASAIVRSSDLHPNLLSLLHEVLNRAQADDLDDAIDDTARFLALFADATVDQQRWLHAVSVLATIVDGRVAASERALLSELRGILGVSTDLSDVEALAKRLRGGKEVTLAQLYPPAPEAS